MRSTYRLANHFLQNIDCRRAMAIKCPKESRRGHYQRPKYWHRAAYGNARPVERRQVQYRTSFLPLIECEICQKRLCKNMIRESTKEVYGIRTPMDFKHASVYHCISNDDTGTCHSKEDLCRYSRTLDVQLGRTSVLRAVSWSGQRPSWSSMCSRAQSWGLPQGGDYLEDQKLLMDRLNTK